MAKRIFGCLPLRTGGGVAEISAPRNELSLEVGTRFSQLESAVRKAGASRSLCQPVRAETFTRCAQGKRSSWRSISLSNWSWRSSSTKSHLFITITKARPASSTIVRILKSCSVMGTEASKTTTATSARSNAEAVRSEA